MKIFLETQENNKTKLDIQPNTINYISVEDLKTYLQIANKYLSEETKEIINWLIVNNKTYLHDLDPSMEAENALAAFYNRGLPKEEHLRELYKCIGKVKIADRILEIPVFQTKQQFEDIISKKISPDEVLLDLKTEAGRNKIVKQYTPLIHKIVRQWIGKSNLSVDELFSIGLLGITYAMNSFGKRKTRDAHGKWVEIGDEDSRSAQYSFTQYAAYLINNCILEEIKTNSHLVRIPQSRQSAERKEKGYNTKSYSVSGDKKVGSDSDSHSKTLFDYVDNGENGYKDINSEDLEKLWGYVYGKLEAEFSERDLDVFYSIFGLKDHKKIKSKDIAKKYNIAPSMVTSLKTKIIRFIKNDSKLWMVFREILDIVGEARQDKYNEEDQFTEAHTLKIDNNSEE